MFVDVPQGRKNGLVIVCDVRLKHDRDLAEADGGSPVLRHWPFGKACIGKRQWAESTRIALYDYGAKLTPELKHQAQSDLIEYLSKHRPSCTLVLQSRSSDNSSSEDTGDAKGLTGTHCWVALHAPDRLPEMAGCVWDAPWGPTIGVLNPVNYEYVYRALIRRHFLAALKVAENHLRPPIPGAMAFHDNAPAHDLLKRLYSSAAKNVPVAIDIESFSDGSVITAIGLSDGCNSVSVPCESFEVFGAGRVEPGGSETALNLVRCILASHAPKVLHNAEFDIPLLGDKGFPVCGSVEDTMAMHVTVYKQWPHGLQKACAQEILVPPWKSEHKPQGARKLGITKKDAEWWTCDPEELRRYNALDAFHTWRLGRALAPKVGFSL
jgi:hypothetical protein